MLPNDLLGGVFAHLAFRDLLSVMATSRDMRALAGAHAPAYRLCVRTVDVADAKTVVAWVGKALPRATIVEIRLRGDPLAPTDDTAMAAVIRACPGLVALSVRECELAGPLQFGPVAAAAAASGIRELRVATCGNMRPLLNGLARRAGGARAEGLVSVAFASTAVDADVFARLIGADTTNAGVCSVKTLGRLDDAPSLARLDLTALPRTIQAPAVRYAIDTFDALEEIATSLAWGAAHHAQISALEINPARHWVCVLCG